MHKDELIARLLKKGQDQAQFVYLVAFFLTFVILIVAIVRPSVAGYVKRRKDLEETKILSSQYQKVIASLNTLQGLLESRRDDFVLLDQAVPKTTQMRQIVKDVESSLLEYVPSRAYNFTGYSVPHGDSAIAPDADAPLKDYKISVSVRGTYSTMQQILAELMMQRRVKSVRMVDIERERGSSESATLDMKLEIEAYHL